MNQHIRTNRKDRDVSRNYARVAGLFTTKRCLLLFLLATTILARPAWQGWQSYKLARTTETQLNQMVGLEQSIMYRDEVLTMSAKMATATGDMKWVSRYEEFGQRTRPTTRESWGIPENNLIHTEVTLAALSDEELTTMENEALELVRQGKHGQAEILLQSEKYDDNKYAYNREMKAIVTNVSRILEDRRDENWKKVQKTLIAISIILPTIVLVWLVACGVGRRIYERKVAKQQISTFAREWQKTFNAISDAVCIIDKNGGKILQCNNAMIRLLKTPYNEIIGRSCCELLHGSSEPVEKCPFALMLKTGRSETADFQAGENWFNVKVDPLVDDNGHLVGAVHILSDITESRKANKVLKESETKFRLAFFNAQDAIVWVEGETGIITNCNKSAEELFGRGRNKIIGQHHTTLYPKDRIELSHGLLGAHDGDPNSNIEEEIIGAGREIKTVTMTVSKMYVEGKEIVQGIMRDVTDSKKANEEIKSLAKFPSEDPNPVLRISKDSIILYANDASSSALKTWDIQEGQRLPEPWCDRIERAYRLGNSATYELDCDDGNTYFMTLQPISGSGYVNAYGLDITKRKKTEKEKMELELQLGQQQKMEAIGTLAGGIAHDFNNILAAMQGYLELSLDDLSEDSPVRDNLNKMMSCTNRATKLVKQILTFSRKDEQEQKREPVQISSMVKEVLGMLRSSLPATIKICRKIYADSSMVMTDPTQIHQVLVNLCTNASHAMRENGGQLEVSLIDVNLESDTGIGDEYLKKGSYVKLSISDSGCGMEKEVLERIFEPFFTTKKVNEGTGLGLSVVHGIIKNHDGAITVNSTPGEGTTFDIFLPRLESGESCESQVPESTAGEKKVILLVDDEEMVIDVTKQTLEKLGFAIIAKTSSIDALEAFQQEPDRFALVITDQVMPNMTGTQLAQNLISIRPDIPVILCSGFPDTICPEELKDIGIREFIVKPISRQEIATTVEKVLDRNILTAL